MVFGGQHSRMMTAAIGSLNLNPGNGLNSIKNVVAGLIAKGVFARGTASVRPRCARGASLPAAAPSPYRRRAVAPYPRLSLAKLCVRFSRRGFRPRRPPTPGRRQPSKSPRLRPNDAAKADAGHVGLSLAELRG